jgi:hypothetical protein
MRGLEEIKYLNENPSAARLDDAVFAPRDRGHSNDAQRYHGERVDARQGQTHADLKREGAFKTRHPLDLPEGLITELVIGAALESIIFGPRTLADRTAEHKAAGYTPGVQDRIHSAIDVLPPFLKFWERLNAERAKLGQEEAFYKDAKEAFNGGPTPDGALTFIGKKWDGVRAVPASDVQSRKAYHGEFREVTDNGTVWRVVANTYGSISYATPEAALGGALLAKVHLEANKS